MKITVITATYNSEGTVRDTIESVLSQSYKEIEYLIVDGASTDNTLEIVREYEPLFEGRMRIISEPDKGIYDALNKGVINASGDIIGFIHADDIFADNDILELIAQNIAEKDCDIIYGDLVYVNSQNTKIVRKWKSRSFEKKLLRRGWMPPHPTLYLRKSVYDKFGLFDTAKKISADYDFILRVFSKVDSAKTVYIPRILIRMRLGGASNRDWKNIKLKMREDLDALRNNNIGGIYSLVWKNLSKIGQFLR